MMLLNPTLPHEKCISNIEDFTVILLQSEGNLSISHRYLVRRGGVIAFDTLVQTHYDQPPSGGPIPSVMLLGQRETPRVMHTSLAPTQIPSSGMVSREQTASLALNPPTAYGTATVSHLTTSPHQDASSLRGSQKMTVARQISRGVCIYK